MSEKVIVALGIPKYTVGTNHAVHGIGDVLHGIVRTYRFAHNIGLPCFINFERHPIRNLLLVEKPFCWPDLDKEVPSCVYQVGKTVNLQNEQHLLTLLQNNNCIYSVHEWCDVPWTLDEVKLVQYIMRPRVQHTIPSKTYNIWHVRLGDSEMVHNKPLIHQFLKLETWFQQNVMNTMEKYVLVSDSIKFKEYIAKKYPQIQISNESPRHSGFHINVTLQDYYTIANAKKVYTWTIHTFGCPSKFAQTAALVGNAELIEIKL